MLACTVIWSCASLNLSSEILQVLYVFVETFRWIQGVAQFSCIGSYACRLGFVISQNIFSRLQSQLVTCSVVSVLCCLLGVNEECTEVTKEMNAATNQWGWSVYCHPHLNCARSPLTLTHLSPSSTSSGLPLEVLLETENKCWCSHWVLCVNLDSDLNRLVWKNFEHFEVQLEITWPTNLGARATQSAPCQHCCCDVSADIFDRL